MADNRNLKSPENAKHWEIKTGLRYCPGCTKLVQIVELENLIYRNTLKLCQNGCESVPNVLKTGTSLMCRHCNHMLEAHANAEARSTKHHQPTCDECARLHRKRCPGWEPNVETVDNLAIVGSDMGYSPEQQHQKMQEMINTGDIWKFEGSMGRSAMDALESGACYLPRYITTDYWGNRLPARYTLTAGTKGTLLNHYRWIEEYAYAGDDD